MTELDQQLRDLDDLYAGVLGWLPRLYDRERGGFYYALSSTTAPGFEADIESTCQAVRIIARCGLIDELPADVRTGVVAFLQSRQDSDTGFFVDRHTRMGSIERLRGRALSTAVETLALLGERPLHPLPAVGRPGGEHTRHLDSTAAFERWLAERPWDNSWLAQDNISAQAGLIALLPPDRQAALVEAALASVRSRQHPRTGFAGGGSPYVQLSGSFKLALFCRVFGRPLPMAPEIYASSLTCLREEICEDACWLRNPLELIEILQPQLGRELPASERREIVAISAANARRFARSDGGFSRQLSGAPAAPNDDVVLGLGLAEGDLNASVQLVTIVRPALYGFAGRPTPPLPVPAGWSDLFAVGP